MKDPFTSRSRQKTIRKIMLYAINCIMGLLFLLPLLWMVASAFKPEQRIFQDISSWKAFIPIDFTLNNFKQALSRVPMFKYIWNSILYIVMTLMLSLTINSLCGYALAKFKFRGKTFVLSLIISLMVFPFDSIVIPLFIVINKMHLLNTRFALILPFTAKCFSIFLFRQFFLDIPNELLEAAEIDGTGRLLTFFKIVLPISGPVFATVFILDFVNHWSDFMWPLIVLIDDRYRTVQLGIQAFFTDPPVFYGPVMAALTLAVLPMVVLFLFFQKYYVQGISTTGLKG
ncbi:carbohydrate ABC transporter permease [uncultured Sphaerochaeta sp.]|uniref:carbohydrate ABC transporter permease n=1 Tax=uncultured Sphaerochaeta sp. TaxID=886478 RepID=UPI002A0A9D4E|nr:carbohydrate ABC transporter permease [uncultured Sphaerochaeta sp.]